MTTATTKPAPSAQPISRPVVDHAFPPTITVRGRVLRVNVWESLLGGAYLNLTYASNGKFVARMPRRVDTASEITQADFDATVAIADDHLDPYTPYR
jgi:hypothetical protein